MNLFWISILVAVILVGGGVAFRRARRMESDEVGQDKPLPDLLGSDRSEQRKPPPGRPSGVDHHVTGVDAVLREEWSKRRKRKVRLDDGESELFPLLSRRSAAEPASGVHGGYVGGVPPEFAVRVDGKVGHWLSGDLPLTDRQAPLPRSGLFVRRNNAFGTKATLGIKDLIEQGVLIDQTQIRFDDFVASNSAGIPVPPAGEAIEASYGVCAAEKNFRANENTTHFVEVALRSAKTPDGDSSPGQAMPVNFVFVVDTSSSMRGEKLDTVKTAIRELYSQLRDTDILGVVSFDTNVRTLLKATPKKDLSDSQIAAVVADLRAHGATDINMGVLYGIDEIARYAHVQPDIVNHLYLFSDGDPTSGVRDWITIRRNIAAKTRGELTLSCFGFGADARMRELEALAGITGGSCALVADSENLRLDLAEDLARREHLAAINIQLQIELDAKVTAWHLYGHDLITDAPARARVERDVDTAKHRARQEFGVESLPDLVTEDDGIRIFAPDLACDETYWVVLEVQAPADWTGFGTATVQYVDVLARENRRQVLELGADTSIAPEIVFAHAVGLWTSEITFYALDDLYQNDRETASSRLEGHAETLLHAHSLAPSAQFGDDRVTFLKLISLTKNLGQFQAFSDGGNQAFTEYALNKFGQIRAGFARNRFS